MADKIETLASHGSLLQELRELTAGARQKVAQAVNSSLVILYWKIGDRIRRDILKEKRANYGEEMVSTLSTQLVTEFGNGFAKRNLFRKSPEGARGKSLTASSSRMLRPPTAVVLPIRGANRARCSS